MGAKAVAELYQQGLCSRQEAQRLLGFCNNSGPAFFIGVVGPTRMDYASVAARLSYFAEGLTKMFGKNELPPKEENHD